MAGSAHWDRSRGRMYVPLTSLVMQLTDITGKEEQISREAWIMGYSIYNIHYQRHYPRSMHAYTPYQSKSFKSQRQFGMIRAREAGSSSQTSQASDQSGPSHLAEN